MIDFRLLNLNNLSLTVEKPTGKAILLRLGEIVEAQIVDILSAGTVTLRIKGNLITAKTNIPLIKGFQALLKVTSLDLQKEELKLQFVKYADVVTAVRQAKNAQDVNIRQSELPKLISELARSISKASKNSESFQILDKDISRLQRLNSEILKSLPQEVNSMPKDTIVQLKSLLHSNLRISGQSIQARLETLLGILPENIKNQTQIANIKANLLINIDKLLEAPVKNILHDTGVLLEAKLRAIAELIRQTVHEGLPKSSMPSKVSEKVTYRQEAYLHAAQKHLLQAEEAQKENITDLIKPSDTKHVNTIKSDLKAGLLELKHLLLNKSEDEVEGLSLKDFPAPNKEAALKVINALIKDIETFQLLSKTTDSFYTFIPVNWKEIRDATLSLKKGRDASGGVIYSCRINLELEKLGMLSAVILMIKGDFFVTFHTDNPHLQSMLRDTSHNLQESFKSRGLNLKNINIMDAVDDSMDYLQKLESQENLINIKI